MAVAVVKATLVVLFFMHVKYASRHQARGGLEPGLARVSLLHHPQRLPDPRLAHAAPDRAVGTTGTGTPPGSRLPVPSIAWKKGTGTREHVGASPLCPPGTGTSRIAGACPLDQRERGRHP